MNFNFVQGGRPRHSRIDNRKFTATLQFLTRKGRGKRSLPNPFGQDYTLVKVPVPGIRNRQLGIQNPRLSSLTVLTTWAKEDTSPFFLWYVGSSCSPLSVGKHVIVQDSCTQAPSPSGTVCDLSCPDNYTLNGPPFQQCGGQGVWSPPTVGPISCQGNKTVANQSAWQNIEGGGAKAKGVLLNPVW